MSLMGQTWLGAARALRLFHELAQEVRLERAEQAELNTEPTRFDPANHGRKPEFLLGSRQGPHDRKLCPERGRFCRLEVHAADTHVLTLGLERGTGLRLATESRVDGDSGMRAFVFQGRLGEGA